MVATGRAAARVAPMRWEELAQLMQNAPVDRLGRPLSTATFGRSPQQHVAYEKSRSARNAAGVSTEDDLRGRLFGDRGRPRPGVPTPAAARGEARRVTLVENDFPYWFEAGARHDCLWASAGPPLSREEIELVIDAQYPDREVVWWSNPPALKSVLGMDHVHIVSRPRLRSKL